MNKGLVIGGHSDGQTREAEGEMIRISIPHDPGPLALAICVPMKNETVASYETARLVRFHSSIPEATKNFWLVDTHETVRFSEDEQRRKYILERLGRNYLKPSSVAIPSDRVSLYEAAIAAYEANTPPDYRYSALAIMKAVDAVLLTIRPNV